MIFSRADEPVTTDQSRASYNMGANSPVWKLFVSTPERIWLEVSEHEEAHFTMDPIELAPGTHNIGFVREVFAFRFWTQSGETAITFRAMGP